MTDIDSNILIGLGTGLASSVLTLIGDRLLSGRRLRRLYTRLNGRYRLYPEGANTHTDEEVEVCYTRARVVQISSRGVEGEWTSRVEMSEEIPEHGRGVFRYKGQTGWGEHSVHFDAHLRQITVFARSVTHADVYGPAWYILKPLTQEANGPTPGNATAKKTPDA